MQGFFECFYDFFYYSIKIKLSDNIAKLFKLMHTDIYIERFSYD